MAARRIGKAGDAARQLAASEQLRRLLEDPKLRESLRDAFNSSRVAYSRLQNGKGPTKALLDDKKLHRELRNTAQALRNVSESLRPPRKRHRGRMVVVIALAGGVTALALSESLRSKLLDAVFGAEEEYDYGSTNASSPAAEPVTTS